MDFNAKVQTLNASDVPAPEHDTNEYMLLTNQNNTLNIMLIRPKGGSGKQNRMGAVSMCVESGSMDTKSGVSHYAEHVFFHGPKLYNKNIQEFVAESGGICNAYTARTRTNFVCTCNEESLTELVDIMIRTFDNPLLPKELSLKEKMAVNSEFEKDSSIEGWREQFVRENIIRIKDLVNPYGQFSIGNNESLKYVDMSDVEQVFELYRRSKMFCAIYSNQDFDQMKSSYMPLFSTLRTGEEKKRIDQSPFTLLRGLFITIDSLDFQNTIEISFPLESCYYKPEKCDFSSLSVLLEYPGGLPRKLQTERLASSVETGLSDNYSFGSVFSIKLVLVDEARKNPLKAVALVFDYMERLYESYMRGDQFSLFGKFMLRKASFDREFSETPSEYEIVESMTEKMIRSSFQLNNTVMNNNALMPDDVNYHIRTLSKFNPESCFITHVCNEKRSYRSTETFYGVKYDQDHVPVDEIKKLMEIYSKDRQEITPIIDKWPARLFAGGVTIDVNDDDKLNYLNGDRMFRKSNNIGNHIFPMTSFDCPEVMVCIKLIPSVNDRPKGFINDELQFREVSTRLLNRALQYEYADYIIAHSSISVVFSPTGYELIIRCLSDNFSTLFLKVFPQFKHYCLLLNPLLSTDDEKQFHEMMNIFLDHEIDLYKKELKNRKIIEPHRQCFENTKFVVDINEPDLETELNDLRIATEKLKHFFTNEMEDLPYRNSNPEPVRFGGNTFTAGYLTDKHLYVIQQSMDDIKTEEKDNLMETQYFSVRNNTLLARARSTIPDLNDKNGAVMILHNIGVTNRRMNELTRIYTSYVKNPFFQELRTNKQLGYVVYADMIQIGPSIYVAFVIQSSVEDPDTLLTEAETFVENFNEKLMRNFKEISVDAKIRRSANMTDDDKIANNANISDEAKITKSQLLEVVRNQKIHLEKEFKNFTEKASEMMAEVKSWRFDFEHRKVRIEFLSELIANPDEFIEYMERWVYNIHSCGRIVIQVFAPSTDDATMKNHELEIKSAFAPQKLKKTGMRFAYDESETLTDIDPVALMPMIGERKAYTEKYLLK